MSKEESHCHGHEEHHHHGHHHDHHNDHPPPTPHGGNFDHAAHDYDEKAERIFRFHGAVVQEIIQKKTLMSGNQNEKEQILLEFGCGTGNVCLPLASHFAHVYGVDISSQMLEKAHEKIRKQSIVNATLRHLEFNQVQQLAEANMPTQYDWIICCMTLHHLPDPMEKLRLFRDLLNDQDGGGIQ